MKHGFKRFLSALLALMLLLPLMGAAADTPAYGVVTMNQVAVRKQASTDADYWFRIDTGFICQIVDQVEKDGKLWYKVDTAHPDPEITHTYIGYILADCFRPLTTEETAVYLTGSTLVTSPDTETIAPPADTASAGSATDNGGASFEVGIMGGSTPTPTPTYSPADEEDDYVSDNVGGTGSFESTGFDTLVTNATGEITASGTNFRLSPSTEGGLIGKMNAGTVVELVTIPAQIGPDYWYRVRYNGQEGYIQSPYIRVLTVGVTPTPAPSHYGYAKLLYDSANLRDAPGGTTQAQWEGKGSLLQIVGVAQQKNGKVWYPVYYGLEGKTYYVSEEVVSLVDYTGTPSNTAVPTQTPDYSGAYGYVITTLPGVNLRLKPGGETVAQVPKGQIVPCVGAPVSPADSSYTWYYVQYGDLRGYLRGDCVKVCTSDGGDIVATPTPAPTSQPSTGAYGYIRLTKGGVNLRARPAGTSLTQLPKDLILPLTGSPVSSGRYDWYPVRTPDGLTGYIRSDCLTLSDAEGNKVTATPAPTPGASGGTPTLSTYGYVQITAGGTNLRDNVAGDTIAQLQKGSVWPMVGLPVAYGQYTWYPITANGRTGWVRGDCAFKLSASQELSYLTGGTVPQETPTPTPSLSNYVITVLDYVNLRTTASRDASAPHKVRTGTVMAYNGTKTVGTSLWYRVVYQGEELWALGSCVEIMTTAEYQQWLSQNGGTTPDSSTATGYVKTIKAGVNVRDAAAGSNIVARLSKGTIVPYYGAARQAGGYSWYLIQTAEGISGYIRSDMVEICTQSGSAVVVPTPTPGASGGQQEATYTTLRLGSTGTAVYNLVSELKNQGYYTGSLTSSYTTAVQTAVRAFQSANGLTVDGIAGSKTQHALFNTVAPGTGDTSSLSFEFYPVEKIDWYTGGIQQLWAKGANYKIYDVETGIVWWAHRWSGGSHADIEPLTAADTARLCQIYGVDDAQEIWDKNLWQRRPCLVTIGTRTFACSLMGMPHNPDGDTIDNNNMTGQICLHFTNSKGHDSGKVDTYHQQAIQEAYDWARARYGAR